MDKQRLDFLVAKRLGVSRSAATKLIETDKVRVGGQIKNKPSTKIDENDSIEIDEIISPLPKALDMKVIYEDADVAVIEKPVGILAHSKGAFNPEFTVADWLLPKTTGFDEGNNRAGIVHRLDRSTSGVMLCAKNPASLTHLQKQFSMRKVKKTYMAIIEGTIDPTEAIIDVPIERNPKDPKRFKASANGKPAQTTYKIVKTLKAKDKTYSLLELTPKTGRTHQLRVHLAHMKRPIVGDDFYGGAKADRLYLHALSLEITLPSSERKVFESNLPKSFDRPKISK